MKAKKGGPALFDADTFVQRLTELVESLPAADEQQKNVAALDDIIRFLSDLRERIAKIPTQEDSTSVRFALNELSALFAKARSNPVLAAAVGLRVTSTRSLGPVPSVEEIEDAKRAISQFEQLPIDQLRVALEGRTAGQLRALAAQLGVRSSQRISREVLAHQIATKITNTRGYRSLRKGVD
jgi:hypothetical protein